MQHTHLLIVNPKPAILRLVNTGFQSLAKDPMTFTIVITKDIKATLGVTYANTTTFDLKDREWDTATKYVSAIAYDYTGQKFLEDISDQIVLSNVKGSGVERLAKYYRAAPPIGCRLIETLSYMGRHVVVSCLEFQEDKQIEMKSTFDKEWTTTIEEVYENLDRLQIINGSTQTYIDNTGIAGIRLHPSNLTYTLQKSGTARHWFDVWPGVLMCNQTKANQAFRNFYNWTEQSGPTAKVYTATPLTI